MGSTAVGKGIDVALNLTQVFQNHLPTCKADGTLKIAAHPFEAVLDQVALELEGVRRFGCKVCIRGSALHLSRKHVTEKLTPITSLTD